MKILRHEKSFLKDLKVLKKRRYPIEKIYAVLAFLIQDQPLPGKYKDRALSGN